MNSLIIFLMPFVSLVTPSSLLTLSNLIYLCFFAEWDNLFIEKLGAELDEATSIDPEELDAAKEMDMKIALALEG